LTTDEFITGFASPSAGRNGLRIGQRHVAGTLNNFGNTSPLAASNVDGRWSDGCCLSL
jgi:hypothetical protein